MSGQSQQQAPRPGHPMPAGYDGGYVQSGYPAYAGGSNAKVDSYDDLHEHGAFSLPGRADDPQQQQGLLSGATAAGAGAGGVAWAAHTPATAARERWMQRQEQYDNGGEGVYNEKAAAGKSNKKWWWIGGILLVLVIAGVGAGVGISKSRSSKKDSPAGVVKSDHNDPSNFTKDSRLKKSFWGMCYTPTNTQYPTCGASQDSIIEDIQLISQLSPRLRLYGADCDVGNLVLTAIEKTKVDMSVYLALWVDDDEATWQRQVQTTKDVIAKHGVKNVAGIGVGNEYILNGGSVATLLGRVNEIKTWVTSQNFDKVVPVGTADAGSMITTDLVEGVDFIFENTHPWFGGVPVDQGAGWTWDYANTNTPGIAVQAATNKPEVFIAEVGWPTGSNSSETADYQAAVSGVPELQTFLDTYICEANTNITTTGGSDVPSSKYFYFEFMDQVWKDELYGGVEGHWGLFDKEKKLKDITIPDCVSP